MIALSATDVSISFGERKILQNISFMAESSQKIGFIGVNGSGKTTLLKIISNQITPDTGTVYISKDYQIGILKQEDEEVKDMTVYEAVLDSYRHLIEMEKSLRELELCISNETNENKLSQFMKKYDLLSEEFKTKGGFEFDGRVKGILRGLGFSDNEFNFPVSSLSGGQRTMLMMARLLSKEPEIMLLDEPTNHLDINALMWLESYLSDCKSTCLIVSHDRFFLDKVCTGIIELENCSVKAYSGNYSAFVEKKKADRENEQRIYDNQQKEIHRLEDFIEQQRRWNREHNIVAAESRMKAIERMDKVNAPQNLPSKIKFHIKTEKSSGTDVLSVKNLSVQYEQKLIFNDISFNVLKGERVIILGPNGCGKSTLLKAITSKLNPKFGTVAFGHNVFMSYYDQEFSGLNQENTVYDEILTMKEKLSQTDIRNTLATFLFKGDDVHKKIALLSGGEKSRLLLTKLILSRPNLIIMDEPTNHLDINSREVLEEALLTFEGTILCVSHDRYFIKKLAGRVIEFRGESIFDFKGNYESYIEHSKNFVAANENDTEKVESQAKIQYEGTKEIRAKERKLKKTIEETESKIHAIEDRLKEIETDMGETTTLSNHIKLSALFSEKAEKEQELEGLYTFWETLM